MSSNDDGAASSTTAAKERVVGQIGWFDLTVDNAEEVRDFYRAVVGWTAEPLSMGEYDDYVMKDANGKGAAGVCHRRGPNSNIPPVWLSYVTVKDVDESARECTRLGGAVLDGPREMGGQRFCVIKDPAGAVLALSG